MSQEHLRVRNFIDESEDQVKDFGILCQCHAGNTGDSSSTRLSRDLDNSAFQLSHQSLIKYASLK